MALVHSRIRRGVFGVCSSKGDKVQSTYEGGASVTGVHSLPGTNHRFEAYRCTEGSDLVKDCSELVVSEEQPRKEGQSKDTD